ncbi:glycosyltransferase family 2 protein [Chitinophaga sp. XS-30]|uniref:glycosyltransferase family 2 protein n=1 Tax=Chitinophaga sp. XS-30 TaxID=2604421 RepID=UPI00143D9CB9|nr:glycosyltransferase family 2 protein [Chitinophaga sp. XS-30]
MPKLSIIIPYYKGKSFLIRLLDSIFRSYSGISGKLDIEILILIDCSTPLDVVTTLINDNLTAEQSGIIKIFRNEKNFGVARTRNRGFKLSIGDYIHFIDQDDEISTDFFETILPLLGKKDFILSNGIIMDTDSKVQYQLYNLAPVVNLRKLILKSFIRSPGQVVLKRALVEDIRFTSARKYFGADDKFFWIDIYLSTKEIKSAYINKCLYIAHKHRKNYSNNYRELSLSCLELWEQFRPRMNSPQQIALMEQDIRIQRFILRDFRSAGDRLRCCWDFLMYKVDLNSFIRFLNKSIKKLYTK